MPRGIGCNNCKICLILDETDYDNSIQEQIFRSMHFNHMVVIGELEEFGSFRKLNEARGGKLDV